MNALRKVLMPLLVIPLGMVIYVCLHPEWQWENPGLEFLFLLLGIPIVIINFFAWFHPEIIRAYFPVKDDWGTGGGKVVTAATAFSVLAAFTCVGIGVASAVADASLRTTFEPSPALPVTSTAFAQSLQVLASATDAGESVAVSTPRESPQVEIIPDQTEQIPVSGGGVTSSATPSIEEAENAASTSSASPESVSAKAAGSTPAGPTGIVPTVTNSGSCTPATAAYMDAIREAVQEEDEQSNVTTGWGVSSAAAEGLWFVAAKIQSDTETIYPGVWGVFVDSEGYMDLYAINDVAMQLSYTDWGEDSEPALTMQSDGAQAAYNCAMQAK